MAYKRFVKRDGKTFGPYYYESYRDGSHVRKRYIGRLDDNKKFVAGSGTTFGDKDFLSFLFLGILILGFILFFALFYTTGQTVLGVSEISANDTSLFGQIGFNIKQGELIPADAVVKVQLNGQERLVPISMLLQGQEQNGTFYVEHNVIEGSGEGYGIIGIKKFYPNVHYRLKLETFEASKQPIYTINEEPKPQENVTETTPIEPAVVEPQETPAEPVPIAEPGITGQAATTDFIDGTVNATEEIVYIIAENQQISLIPESVRNDSDVLPDSTINLEINEGNASVTTDYYTEEHGFGPEFLTSESVNFAINLSDFGIAPENGVLKIQIVYQNIVLVETENIIQLVQPGQPQPPVENITLPPAGNETGNATEIPANVTENATGLRLLKNIDDISMSVNINYTLNPGDYFAEASGYNITAIENITTFIENSTLTLAPDTDFIGDRKAKVTAYNASSWVESNEFMIYVISGKAAPMQIESTPNTNLTSCQVLDTVGTYYLNTSIGSTTTCINITSNNVKLNCRGYMINGTDPDSGNNLYYGIYSQDHTNITIVNCTVMYWRTAGVSMNNVSNSRFENITCQSEYNNGFTATGSNNNTYNKIRLISNGNSGMTVSGNSSIFGNISSFGHGSGNGLSIAGFNNSIFNYNSTSDYYGLIIGGGGNNTVNNCSIYNAGYGIDVTLGSFNNTITKCKLINTAWTGDWPRGIRFTGGSNGTKVYDNNITYGSGVVHAEDLSGINYWNTTKTAGPNIIGGTNISGNFWGDYGTFGGSDLDGDSIGDTNVPYNASNNISVGGDYLPLLPKGTLNSCGTLSSNTTEYVLKQAVSGGTATCFTITGINVTLNCTSWDNTITYGNISASGARYGIYSSKNSTIVRNCEVTKGELAAVSNARYGVYFDGNENGKIQNVNASINQYGIYLDGDPTNVKNITIFNCTADNNSLAGITLYQSFNNNITLNNISKNQYGIYIAQYSNGSSIVSNSIKNNTYYGIYMANGAGNLVTKNLLQENQQADLWVSADWDYQCQNIIQNNTGSGGRSIVYYNTSYLNIINNNSMSELILCNSAYSNITNVTIKSSNSIANNGLILVKTSFSNVTSCNSSFTYNGLYLRNSENNTITSSYFNNDTFGIYLDSGSNWNNITGNTAKNNRYHGLYFYAASHNDIISNIISNNTRDGMYIYNQVHEVYIYNNTVDDNGYYGIELNSQITNITVYSNRITNSSQHGLYLYSTSQNNITGNTISNNNWSGISTLSSSKNIIDRNVINNNSQYGIGLLSTSTNNNITSNTIKYNSVGINTTSSTNLVYNNYFKNTKNAFDTSTNDWNKTKTAGSNIVLGPNLGGNYWNDYTGVDNTGDGIGDTNLPYNSNGLITNGGDYLPLMGVVCGGILTDDTTLTADLNCNGTGLNIGSNNLVLDCAGHKLTGNGSGYGINISGYESVTVENCIINKFEDGIYSSYSPSCSFGFNTLYNNSIGFEVTVSSNGRYYGNILTNNTDKGFDLVTSSVSWFNNNTVVNSGTAFNVYITASNFTYNTVYNCTNGIGISQSSNSLVLFNNITNNTGLGISISESFGVNVTSNIVEGNTYGIGLSVSNTNNVISNKIQNNTWGLNIDSNSQGNTIFNNLFNNNAHTVYATKAQVWNMSKTSGTNIIGGGYLGGNYWSDYTGTDSDDDGIGNTLLPYNASSNITQGGTGDWLPLIYPGTTSISSCQKLASNNAVYQLSQTVNTTTTCFNITATNVTLDCNGWSNVIIYGNLSTVAKYYGVYSNQAGTTVKNCAIKRGERAAVTNDRYAIYFNGVSNGLISNVNASTNRYGMNISGSGNLVNNSITSNNSLYGIILASSTGSTINNVTAGLNSDKGIFLINSNGSTLTGNNASNNLNHGIFLASSSNNTLDSNTLQENSAFDFYISADSDDQCNNSIQNTAGSGGRSILYYNTSATLSNNDSLAELVLCNADYSSIDNVKVSGSSTLYNDGILITRTDYTNISNSNSSNNLIGFNISGNGNLLKWNNANNNTLHGIYLENAMYSIVDSNIANKNANNGIYLNFCNGTLVQNNTLVNNQQDGIQLSSSMNNTLFYNNAINNSVTGIILSSSSNNNVTGNTANRNTAGGSATDGSIELTSSTYNIIMNNTIKNNYGYGITLASGSDYNNISLNFVSNASTGIEIASDGNYIINNTCNNNYDVPANTGHGIRILTGINNIIANNTARYNKYGIQIETSSSTNIVTQNEASLSVFNGIVITTTATNNNITFNNASNNNQSGIRLANVANNNTITNNSFNNNNLSGIWLDFFNNPSAYNTIVNNTAINNSYGIYLDYNYRNVISSNVVKDNGVWDVFVVNSASATDSICNNTVTDNAGSGDRAILFYNTTDTVNLQNNDTLSELILCNSDSAVVNNVTIKGSDVIYNNGILLIRLNYSTISNFSSLSNRYGIYIYNSQNNNLSSGTINDSVDSAIYLTGPSSGNIFQNITVTNTNASKYDLEFATTNINDTHLIDMILGNYTFTSIGKLVFKITAYAEIKFLAAITATGNNLSADIAIGNNSVAVDSAAKTGLNKSANITFYNMKTDFVSPIILRNGLTCPSSICYNYTDLNAGTVVFNVTGWTNYSIGELYTSLNITGCQSLDEANKIYVLMQSVVSTTTCFNVTANNVTLDCINWSNKIYYGNQSSAIVYHGVFSNQNSTTVRNCQISKGEKALETQARYGITFLISNNGTIMNSNVSHNRIGIYFNATLNSTIFNNTFTNSSLFGIYLNKSTTDNTIYNNYFNNTRSINAYANDSNNWNVTLDCAGIKNIIGGSCIGGNFWGDYLGVDNTGDNIGDTLLPYNASNNITVPGTGDWLPLLYPIPTVVTLNSPLANLTTDTNMLIFNCSVTGFTDLANMSLSTNTSGAWKIDVTKPATGSSATTIFVLDRIPNGTYDWNCVAAGASGTATASANRNFTINQTVKAMVTKINSTGTYYRIWDNGVWQKEIKTLATLNELALSRFQSSAYGGAVAYVTGDENHYGKALAGNCAFNKTNWTCGSNYISTKQVFNSWGYGISSGNYLFNGSGWITPFSSDTFPRYIEGIDSYGKKVALLYQKGEGYNPALTLKIWNGYDFSLGSVLNYEETIKFPSTTGGYYRGIAGDLMYDKNGNLLVAYANPGGNVSMQVRNDFVTIEKTHIPVAETETIDKIKLSGNGSNIILGSNGYEFYIEIWDGSAWSDFNLLDSNTGFNITYNNPYSPNINVFDIAFNKNKALIAWVDNVTGSNVVKYRFWDGSLQAEQTLAVSDKPRIVEVAGNPNGNEFILTTVLNNSNTTYFVYDGSSWDAGLSSGKVSFTGQNKDNVYANLPVSFINNFDTNLEPVIKLNNPDFKTIFEKGVDTSITFNCEVWDDAGIDNISIYSDLYVPHGWGFVYNVPVNGSKYYNLSYTADITLVGGGPYQWNCIASDIGNKVSEAGLNKTFSIAPQVVNLSDCYLGPNYGNNPGLPNESYVVVGVEVAGDWASKTPSWVHVCRLLDNSVNISQGQQAFSYWGVSKPSTTQVLVGVQEVHYEFNYPWDQGWASKWAQSAKITNGIVNLRNCYTGGSNYGYTNNFNQVKPYFVAIGSDLGDTHPIVSRRATWVQVCELATYELISVFLIEPDDDTVTMDDNVLFNCSAASSVNNLTNLSMYIRELENPLVATVTAAPGQKELSVDYTYNNLPPGKYHWNCEAIDNQSRNAWAPKDYVLKKYCLTPSDDMYVNENTILCNGTYHVTDANKDGILIVNGASDITIRAMNTTIISDNGGTFLNITYSDSVVLNGTSITSIDNHLALYEFEHVANILNATSTYIYNLNASVNGTPVITVKNSEGSIIDKVGLFFNQPDYTPSGTMVSFTNSNGAGLKNSNISIFTQTAGSYTAVTALNGQNYLVNTSITGTGGSSYDPLTPIKGVNTFNFVLYNNVGGFDYCIIGSTYSDTIEQNNVTVCHYGIKPGDNAVVINNSMSRNDIALWMQGSNNIITWNKFTGNDVDVLMNEPGKSTNHVANNNTLSTGLDFVYTSDINGVTIGDGIGMFGCINCNNLTVQNIYAENTSFAAYIEGDNITFQGVNGSRLLNGLWVKGASNVNITNVRLVNGTNIAQPPAEEGPYASPYSTSSTYGLGVYLYNSDKNAVGNFQIQNLTLHGTFNYGLVAFGGTSLTNDAFTTGLNIGNSTFETVGIDTNTAATNISYNNFTNSYITINKGGNIVNNSFNVSGVQTSGGGTVDSNTFSGGNSYLTLKATAAIFKNNLIRDLFIITTPGTGSNNLIYNNLFNKSVTVSYSSSGSDTNKWNSTLTAGTNIVSGSNLGGNYWKYYTGVDLTGDGIGDTLLPFISTTIRSGNGDWLPLVIAGACGSAILNNTVLDHDITCDSTAVIIGNNSVSFDCAGHSITGIGVGNGVETNDYNNTVVKNCRISNFSIGIEFGRNTNNTALNNTVNLTKTVGILFSNATLNNVINNTAILNLQTGIVFQHSNTSQITNNNASNNGLHGFYVWDSANCNVTNNIANSNPWIGIYLLLSNNGIVKDNTANLNSMDGIDIAICLNTAATNNTANWNIDNGLFISVSNYTNAVNNTANYNTRGIHVYKGFYNNVTNNLANHNFYSGGAELHTTSGIYLESSASNLIFNNTLCNSTYMFSSGLDLYDSTYNIISNNNISSNLGAGGEGLYLHSNSNYNNITNNTVVGNGHSGIFLEIGAGNNSIYNNFFNNTANAFDDGANYWNTTYDCTGAKNIISGNCTGGNWWSDYAGADDGSGVYPHNNSNDGVGDTLLPYNSTSGIVNGGDWLPLMYPYNDTTPPNVTLLSPANNTLNTSSQTIVFIYNVSDDTGIANCSLIINSAINLTNSTILNNETGYFTQTLANSDYLWSVNCTDNSTNHNQGSSATYNLSINVNLIPPTFSNPSNTSDTFQRWHNFTANITIRSSGESALDAYIFATNASGAWVNKTVDISGAEYNASESANITLARGNSICWYYWANDTFGNSNQSSNYCFIVNDTAPTHSNPWIGAHNRLTSGLAGEWRFENSNATWTYDETGMNNGTVSGANLSDKGRVGRGFEFDGNDYITTGRPNAVNPVTFSVWANFKDNRSVTNQNLFQDGTTYIQYYNGGWRCVINNAGVTPFTYNIALGWHHFACEFNNNSGANNIKFYIDGKLNQSGSYANQMNNGTLYIGCYGTTLCYNGTIDEVMIFNRSLSADEIADVYNTSSGKFAYDSQDIGASANETSDTDNDVLTNIYNWYQNNVSVALLNMPFDVERISAKDYTGNNNGTMTPSTKQCPDNYCYLRQGVVGNALTFDGVAAFPNFDKVDVNWSITPSLTAITNTTNITVSVWFNGLDAGNNGDNAIFVMYNASGNFLQLAQSGNKTIATLYYGAGASYITSINNVLNDSKWHHAVINVIRNGTGGFRMWMDGVYQGSGVNRNTAFSTYGAFRVGGSTHQAYTFYGMIDEFKVWNRTLSDTEISNIYTNESAGKYDANMDRTGLQVELNFNESAPSLVTLDTVAQVNESLSTFMGRRPHFNATGKYGSAYQFVSPGTLYDGEVINVPSMATQNLNFSGTISLWAYANQNQNYITMFEKRAGGGNGIYMQNEYGSQMHFSIDYGPECGVWYGSATKIYLVTGRWQHYVMTWDNATRNMSVYVNGTLLYNNASCVIDQSSVGIGNNLPMTIGNREFTYTSQGWNGSIDEVMIFNRSLSASEVKTIYESGYRNINKQETNLNDLWQVCITPADGWLEGDTKCSWNMSIMTLSSPILYKPLAENLTVFERQPVFEWFNVTGIEPITYDIQVANDSGFANGNVLVNGQDIVQGSGTHSETWDNLTSYTNTTVTLPYDTILFWKVRAKNGDGASAWSETRNFTIKSVVSVNFTVDTINFGDLTLGQSNDTTGNSPYPFVIQNDGNVKINGTGTSTYLWTSQPEPSKYYQYKMRVNETGAFNDTLSTTNWKNSSYINTDTDLAYLLYQMNQNAVFMDIGVTGPSDEPPGYKSAVFTMTVQIAE
jgi:parallel beta-helix repeat protein